MLYSTTARSVGSPSYTKRSFVVSAMVSEYRSPPLQKPLSARRSQRSPLSSRFRISFSSSSTCSTERPTSSRQKRCRLSSASRPQEALISSSVAVSRFTPRVERTAATAGSMLLKSIVPPGMATPSSPIYPSSNTGLSSSSGAQCSTILPIISASSAGSAETDEA